MIKLQSKLIFASFLIFFCGNMQADIDKITSANSEMSSEEALQIIRYAKPASLTSELVRDLAAMALAASVYGLEDEKLFLDDHNNGKSLTEIFPTFFKAHKISWHPTQSIYINLTWSLRSLIPLFPVFSMIFNYFEHDNSIDKALNTLLSTDNLHNIILKNSISIKDIALEINDKINDLQFKEKNKRLILKCVESISLAIATYFVFARHQFIIDKIDRHQQTPLTCINLDFFVSCIIELIAMGFLMYKLSAHYKNRTEKVTQIYEKLIQGNKLHSSSKTAESTTKIMEEENFTEGKETTEYEFKTDVGLLE